MKRWLMNTTAQTSVLFLLLPQAIHHWLIQQRMKEQGGQA